MAWNKLPKNRPTKNLDRFDLEAEAEGKAIMANPSQGTVGKRIAKMRRQHDRGNAIVENKATKRIQVS